VGQSKLFQNLKRSKWDEANYSKINKIEGEGRSVVEEMDKTARGGEGSPVGEEMDKTARQ